MSRKLLKAICFCLQINNETRQALNEIFFNTNKNVHRCLRHSIQKKHSFFLVASSLSKHISAPKSRSTKCWMIHYLPSPLGLTSHIFINSLGLYVSAKCLPKMVGENFQIQGAQRKTYPPGSYYQPLSRTIVLIPWASDFFKTVGEEVWSRKKKMNWFLNIWHNCNDKINIKMIALKKLATKKYQPSLPVQNDPPLNHPFVLFHNISDSLPLRGANKIHSPTYKKEGSNCGGWIKKIF